MPASRVLRPGARRAADAPPAGSGAPVLSARGLWVAPPGARECVVRDFSLDLRAGEWVAVTGGNGAGKTTLALALAGLWPIARGTLALDGEPFGARASPARRADVAVLLQDPASQLLQGTLEGELAFAARNLDRPEPEIARAMSLWSARLGLEAEPDRDPRTLSAGGQQLALAAAAMISGPRLLIADEAASHLDARARARLLEALRAETGRGLALVWVSQDPGEIAAADRCVTLGAPCAAGLARAIAGSAPGAPVAKLRVGLPREGEGPRIRLSRPLEVTLHRRGVTALTGSNGAGKSVLLAAAAGVFEFDQVKVEWLERGALPPILAPQFPEQQIFQERALDEAVWAAVSRGLPRAEVAARVTDCLRALGFEPSAFLRRRVWDLSGGEKRLLEAVSALVAPAPLLALDEPTAGLDPARRAALAALVAARAEEGPVLIASQDAGWIKALPARVVALGGEATIREASLSKKTD